MILYAVLLENEKFFLHPSINEKTDNLFIELELLYPFITIHKPYLIIETYYIWDIQEVDVYVKKYMKERGIQNVRGGSYCDVDLPEYKIKALENEFSLDNTKIINKLNIIHNVVYRYKNMDFHNRNSEKLVLIKKLDEYYSIKKNLHHFGTLDIDTKLNRNFLSKIEWIHRNITNESFPITSTNTKKVYRDIMLKFQKLSALFFEKFPEYEFLPLLHYYRPDVVFDKIFIHKQYSTSEENIANELCSKFEFMYHKMINYLDEIEFDLQVFPEQFEDESVLTLKYLETLVSHE